MSNIKKAAKLLERKDKMKKYLIIGVILGSIMFLFDYAQADVRVYSRHNYRHSGSHRNFQRAYFYFGRAYYPSRVYHYSVYPVTYYPEDSRMSQVNPAFLPITEIVKMASQGVPDAVIISEIDRTRSSYILSSGIIEYLKENKVSDLVIDYMLATRKKYSKLN